MRVITVLILVIVSTEREEVKEVMEATRKETAELMGTTEMNLWIQSKAGPGQQSLLNLHLDTTFGGTQWRHKSYSMSSKRKRR
jgi:hypothetical protein